MTAQLAKLEQEVYEWHLQVYDAHLAYLEEEEQLYKHQKAVIKHNNKGRAWNMLNYLPRSNAIRVSVVLFEPFIERHI